MKIVKSFEDSGLLLKGVNKTIKNKKTVVEILQLVICYSCFVIWPYDLVG